MKQSVLVPILTNEYYNLPKYYRYMTNGIFDALETAFLSGSETADVPEADFIKMITEIQLSDGSQNN